MSDPIPTKTPSEADGILARSFLFAVLSQVFRHPVHAEASFFSEQDDALGQAVNALPFNKKEKLKSLILELFRECRALSQEERIRGYEQSFRHTVNGQVPAYELEYGEEHSHREPRELSDITAFYEAFGLNVSDSARERADHISAECEFVYFLLFKQAHAQSLGESDNARLCGDTAKKFLSEHLGRWLPAFALRLSRFGCGKIMPLAAELALEIMMREAEHSGISLGDQNLPLRNTDEKEEVACASCSLGDLSIRRHET